MPPKIIQSIKTYYPIALAEHEGAGTAYEYFMKAKVITAFLGRISSPVKSVLIGGLPQKYGFSFDFVLLSQIMKARLKVIDDRQERLDEFISIFHKLKASGYLQNRPLETEKVKTLTDFTQREEYDLVISCEVLQRLEDKAGYFQSIKGCGRELIVFAPNAGNASHAGLSGLGTVELSELENLLTQTGRKTGGSGYIDLPPFPPGISRSEDQRAKAKTGLVEQVAFMVFQWWGNTESFFPKSIRENKSHIVYIYT